VRLSTSDEALNRFLRRPIGTRRVGFLGLIVAFSLSGCGGGSGGGNSGASGPKPLSAQQFRAQAIADCAQANELESQLTKPSEIGELPSYFEEVLVIAKNLEEKLSRLQPPPQDASSFQRLVKTFHTEAVELSSVIPAAKSGNAEEVQNILHEFQTSNAAEAAEAKVAISNLGLKECEPTDEPGG
jgi:hypothetical protein